MVSPPVQHPDPEREQGPDRKNNDEQLGDDELTNFRIHFGHSLAIMVRHPVADEPVVLDPRCLGGRCCCVSSQVLEDDRGVSE